ncbi:MAG: RNA pseudouridine synthase [Bacteroidetes bacterium GWE2_29_8]|nr:MAG: RNA pseudouridine synthase [Bacteroidetes bacterium GWE2_29_8]OFY17166.1 MAG: RNA pseudouridine synthase [Bacteroidetes bacterium GWF2_29_10]
MLYKNIEKYILYEDNHILIFNKQPSMLVQGDKTEDIPITEHLKDYLKLRDKKPGNVFMGVVHRIDRPVSGVVIFAKTSKALKRLNEMLKNHEIKKTYWALTSAQPPNQKGTLINYLMKNQAKNFVTVFDKEKDGAQYAELEYELISKSNTFFLLKINLLTGRSHQVRSQLSHINCPIVGDNKYGYKRSNPDRSICLHAREIQFTHPVSKINIHITAPTPVNSIWDLFKQN